MCPTAAGLRLAALFLLATTLPAAEVKCEAPPEPQAETLAVVMKFEEDFSPPVVQEMQQEVEEILEPARFGLRWRFAQDHGGESSNHLITVKMKGRCAVLAGPRPKDTSLALAATDIVDGTIIPYCDLNCDRVRNFIEPVIAKQNPQRSERLLGRALGRVLAHELYHILTATVRHGRTAVTRPRLSPEELTSGALNLESSDVAEICARRAEPRR